MRPQTHKPASIPSDWWGVKSRYPSLGQRSRRREECRTLKGCFFSLSERTWRTNGFCQPAYRTPNASHCVNKNCWNKFLIIIWFSQRQFSGLLTADTFASVNGLSWPFPDKTKHLISSRANYSAHVLVRVVDALGVRIDDAIEETKMSQATIISRVCRRWSAGGIE